MRWTQQNVCQLAHRLTTISNLKFWEMQYSQYFYNTFVTNPKWWIVIGGQKNNFSGRLKLQLIRTYNLWFVMKTL